MRCGPEAYNGRFFEIVLDCGPDSALAAKSGTVLSILTALHEQIGLTFEEQDASLTFGWRRRDIHGRLIRI